MSNYMYFLRGPVIPLWALVSLWLVALVAWGEGPKNEDKALTEYINQIKSRPALSIEALPKRLGEELNSYPKMAIERNPFKPRSTQHKQKMAANHHVQPAMPLLSELIQINYAKVTDIQGLVTDKNSSLLSKRGRLSADERTNRLWVKDTSRRVQKIKAFIKQLDTPVKQVQIDARIVNVTKEAILDLGVRFGVSKPGQLSGTLRGANQLLQGAGELVDRLNVDFGAPVQNPASLGIALAKLGDGLLLDLELSALESEDKAEIIANPRLVAANQQAAVIESGEEIPYQEATLSGATAVAFKKAVLSLKVIPEITSDQRLMMEIAINQDVPSGRFINGVPAINTKSIHTNVLINNGQTIVLGGIYQQDKNKTIKRVPFLGDLPIIGALFRNLHRKVKNEELLIFITPRIITNNLSMTATPGDAGDKNFAVSDYSKIVHNEVVD
jgi:type IV pilus assembly protein PilQ